MNKLILAGLALAIFGISLIIWKPDLPAAIFLGSFFLIAALPLVIISIVFVRLSIAIWNSFSDADNGKRVAYALYFGLFLFWVILILV